MDLPRLFVHEIPTAVYRDDENRWLVQPRKNGTGPKLVSFSFSTLPPQPAINCVRWSPNGDRLAVGTDVFCFLLPTAHLAKGRILTHRSRDKQRKLYAIRNLAWSPDGNS